MAKKILIPIYKKKIAPRFDLALEALVVEYKSDGSILEEKMVVLPHASAEDMCNLVLTEKVDTVICNGIDEEHYHYLLWKKVKILDCIIGSYENALKRFLKGELKQGDIVGENEDENT